MWVRTQTIGSVATLTLQDPDRRNAISLALVDELEAALRDLAADPDVHALVVTGAGKAFCSGADRAALRDADEATLRRIYSAFLMVRDFPLPTVAAVNGPAVGAGLNLALACDVRIAAESALFDARFVNIPVHPGGGHTWMLDRASQSQTTAAMAMFSAPVGGARAVELGLAWSCVPDDELAGAAADFCRNVVAAPRELLVSVKRSLRDLPGLAAHAEAMELELERQLESMASSEYAAAVGRKR